MRTPKFPPDFKELLRLFTAHNVKYLIVGGYAVAFHGHPRFTGDLDLWVEASESNASKVVTALREFGFDAPNLKKEHFLGKDTVTSMGVEPMKVEIFTHIPGLEFKNSFQSKSIAKLEVGDIWFVSLEDLKTAKRTSGRAQDLADLEELP